MHSPSHGPLPVQRRRPSANRDERDAPVVASRACSTVGGRLLAALTSRALNRRLSNHMQIGGLRIDLAVFSPPARAINAERRPPIYENTTHTGGPRRHGSNKASITCKSTNYVSWVPDRLCYGDWILRRLGYCFQYFRQMLSYR